MRSRVNPVLFFVIPAFLCGAVVALLPPTASAQFGSAAVGVQLLLTPEFPSPEGSVEVSLSDYTVDTVGATVSWYVDGVLRKEFTNERSIKIQAGKLGTTVPVRVMLSRSGAPSLSASVDVVPSQVDLIIEADTYVPDFYRGRALPSPESSARAIAVVHDGSGASASSYTYTWEDDGSVLFGGPVKGKQAIDFTVSRFRGKTLGVTVTNSAGVTVGERTIEVPQTEPRLLFYEYSPLRGLLERAVTGPLPLISEEVTVYGEPYFFHTGVARGDAEFSWRIDGSPVNVMGGEPNAVTLRQVGAGGGAEVNLRVVSTKRIPQVVDGSFRTFFE